MEEQKKSQENPEEKKTMLEGSHYLVSIYTSEAS